VNDLTNLVLQMF